jgi:uncharacterized protein
MVRGSRLFPRLQLGAMCLAVFVAGQSLPQAQMPADTQFIKNVRERNYGESMPYLVNGGTPNARDYDDVPALFVAAEIDDASMVRSLLEYGANPNIANKSTGETALMRGATKGNIDIIALLIYTEADLDQLDNGGETALIKAVRAGKPDIVRLLLEAGADHELSDYTGQTPLDHAIRGRDRRVEAIMREAEAGS